MASASLTARFAGLEVDAVPDAPRDVVPQEEKKEAGCAPSVVSLHGAEGTTVTEAPASEEAPERAKVRRSSSRQGQNFDMGRQLPPLQLPFPVRPVGSGGGNVVLVNQSNGVQVGDTVVYNSTNVTSPSGKKFTGWGSKPKKIDAEEKCLEDLRAVSDRVTTDDISAISAHVGVNWKVLGRRLRYTDGQLDQFYLNFEKLQMKEVVYQMLLDWKRTRTSKATVKSLAKHLYKSSEVDAMMELHKTRFDEP
ncbi:uncharacterized protein LOC134540417 [Bacillus rossius redtenbacheri]|uniref:uncharacterized protein LOC134540417 n=1 Tax=Bacillus rossius redtenbacheri TaxID=93214 RepID=UPI002FDD009F